MLPHCRRGRPAHGPRGRRGAVAPEARRPDRRDLTHPARQARARTAVPALAPTARRRDPPERGPRAVRHPGPLLAAGRDADVFEYGDGAVLRRSREGRSLLVEARTLEFLHAHDYPVPKVIEVSEDGAELAMERVETDDGRRRRPEALDAASRGPDARANSPTGCTSSRHRVLPPAPVGAARRCCTWTCTAQRDDESLPARTSSTGPARVPGSRAVVVMAWVLMAVGESPAAASRPPCVRSAGRALVADEFVQLLRSTDPGRALRPSSSAVEGPPHERAGSRRRCGRSSRARTPDAGLPAIPGVPRSSGRRPVRPAIERLCGRAPVVVALHAGSPSTA